jgi:prepilin-type N-terminal cleavage/methylation domain-containing protein
MKKMNKKAFTLIELLIVIAIIGILFIVLVSKVDFATDKAKATGVQTDFRSYQMAFETVAREHAGFEPLVVVVPNEDGDDTLDLTALVEAVNKNLDAKLQITYADGEMTIGAKDPWKELYTIEYVAAVEGEDRGAFVVYSCGANLTKDADVEKDGGVVTHTNDVDDYVLSTVYTIAEGAGQVVTTTSGFSNNQ